MKVTSVKLTRLSVLKKINGSHLGIQYIHQCCQLPAAEMNIRFIWQMRRREDAFAVLPLGLLKGVKTRGY